MMPLERFTERFEREFEVGKYYTLEPVKERSRESHNLYFACVNFAWLNLPHPLSDRFTGPDGDDDFRKWCLIKRGWCYRKIEVFETEDDAKKTHAVILALPTFVVVVQEGTMLTIMVARTQRLLKNDPEGMDKKDFEASKRDVIEECCFWLKMTEKELVAAAKSQMVREKAA